MQQYLELVARILSTGRSRGDRTGTGTISLFGTQTRYNLDDGFPLLTTKAVNFKAVVAELIWMIGGFTNVNDLDSKIWGEWAKKDGDLGPIYGHQWRNWGGNNYGLNGIDQIARAIHTIKTDPDSRRIIVSAWNVEDLGEMQLSTCHLLFQFYVRDQYLDCQLYQRSADMALGVPFNIASYALLTTMIANECGLVPGEFVHTIGDAHIYLNHVDGLKRQIEREERPLPRIILADKKVDDIRADDIDLVGYDPHPAIKFEVSV